MKDGYFYVKDPQTGEVVLASVNGVQRTSKMGNRKTQYGSVTYHSAREAAYAAELDLRVKAKDIKRWERQIGVPLEVHGTLIAKYVIDFVIEHTDGTFEYVEVKGFETDVWKLKWKLFEALYPQYVKTIVK